MKLIALLIAAAAPAGPIAGLGETAPAFDYESGAPLEDIERCLLDVPGWLVPSAYRQPDRPDEVRLLWLASPSGGGLPIARIDLHRGPGGTHVRGWVPKFRQPARVENCAPKAGPGE